VRSTDGSFRVLHVFFKGVVIDYRSCDVHDDKQRSVTIDSEREDRDSTCMYCMLVSDSPQTEKKCTMRCHLFFAERRTTCCVLRRMSRRIPGLLKQTWVAEIASGIEISGQKHLDTHISEDSHPKQGIETDAYSRVHGAAEPVRWAQTGLQGADT
jgi:hypothetical protein